MTATANQAVLTLQTSHETFDVVTSYEPFSREPQYTQANRDFIRTLPVSTAMNVLDLACGTAAMTDELVSWAFIDADGRQRHPTAQDRFHVTGLDLSRESLSFGRRYLAGRGLLVAPELPAVDGAVHVVDLVEGTATELPVPSESVDLVIMGNAIQLVDELDTMLEEIRRVLKPGGMFGFNTSFYAGTYCPGTEHVYIRWVQEALAWVRERDAELKAAGQPGIKRERGKSHKAFSKPWLSADDYADALQRHGMTVSRRFERTVMLNQRCFETIGAYAELAKVLLSGYPVKLASQALQHAAGTTLAAVGMKEVPRYWLEMTAGKSQA